LVARQTRKKEIGGYNSTRERGYDSTREGGLRG